MIKPSIVEVIGQRIKLRKAGKEYKGLCPFHSEKTPSFTVNEDKGLFNCFGCGAAGDVFDFIMQLDGVTFPEAVECLGIDSTPPSARYTASREALIITSWCNAQFDKAQSLLREIGDRLRHACDLKWKEEVQLLSREWAILSELADDLQNPKCAISLFDSRNSVEKILQHAPLEPMPAFPELTPEYRQRLAAYVRGDA